MLGSLFPSSRFLVERLLRKIDWSQARVIVEYGPGVGSFTVEILRRMRPDALLIVMETNPDFVDFLRCSFSDARLRVVHGSAVEVKRVLQDNGLTRADFVFRASVEHTTGPRAEEILRNA
jgi:phospholipid N-methyltransferase